MQWIESQNMYAEVVRCRANNLSELAATVQENKK